VASFQCQPTRTRANTIESTSISSIVLAQLQPSSILLFRVYRHGFGLKVIVDRGLERKDTPLCSGRQPCACLVCWSLLSHPEVSARYSPFLTDPACDMATSCQSVAVNSLGKEARYSQEYAQADGRSFGVLAGRSIFGREPSLVSRGSAVFAWRIRRLRPTQMRGPKHCRQMGWIYS
jgi:hypothetical protein